MRGGRTRGPWPPAVIPPTMVAILLGLFSAWPRVDHASAAETATVPKAPASESTAPEAIDLRTALRLAGAKNLALEAAREAVREARSRVVVFSRSARAISRRPVAMSIDWAVTRSGERSRAAASLRASASATFTSACCRTFSASSSGTSISARVCPADTRSPRSTVMERTNPATRAWTVTCWLARKVPGSAT